MTYSAGIISTSFWYLESKITAEYMLEGLSKKEIFQLCLDENIYQVDSDTRSQRACNTIFRRLKVFNEEMLQYLINCDSNSGKLFVLISVLRDDQLFFEFMYEVFRDHIILGNYALKRSDFEIFFRNKANQSEIIDNLTEQTVHRVIGSYVNMLYESGLIESEDSNYKIIPPFLDYRLRNLLIENDLEPFLKAITGEN